MGPNTSREVDEGVSGAPSFISGEDLPRPNEPVEQISHDLRRTDTGYRMLDAR
jgi:hypothetical protein